LLNIIPQIYSLFRLCSVLLFSLSINLRLLLSLHLSVLQCKVSLALQFYFLLPMPFTQSYHSIAACKISLKIPSSSQLVFYYPTITIIFFLFFCFVAPIKLGDVLIIRFALQFFFIFPFCSLPPVLYFYLFFIRQSARSIIYPVWLSIWISKHLNPTLLQIVIALHHDLRWTETGKTRKKRRLMYQLEGEVLGASAILPPVFLIALRNFFV